MGGWWIKPLQTLSQGLVCLLSFVYWPWAWQLKIIKFPRISKFLTNIFRFFYFHSLGVDPGTRRSSDRVNIITRSSASETLTAFWTTESCNCNNFLLVICNTLSLLIGPILKDSAHFALSTMSWVAASKLVGFENITLTLIVMILFQSCSREGS